MTRSPKGIPKRPPETSSFSRWPKRLMIGGGVIAFILLVAVVLAGTLSEPLGGVPEGTKQVAVGSPDHIEGALYAVDEVPAGGPMASIWANCGFYDVPMPAENVVHSLEHGAVWITYQPDIPQGQVDVLRRLSRPGEKVLASPIDNQGSQIMATAWGFQLEVESTEDPRLEQFIVEFAGSLSAPEAGGSCTRGVGVPG